MGRFSLAEETRIVEAIAPCTGAAAAAGDYINMKYAPRIAIVVHIAQGDASTVALTIEQAKAADGTGSKAITEAVPIWANEDCAAGDKLTKKDKAVSFTTSAALKNKIVVFHVDTDILDKANGYEWICVKAGASDADNLLSAEYVVGDLRYGAQDSPSLIS
ncbi:MAG: hypothetical protein IKT09_04990 [Synergistes sp.]|nr:hypothetical protein [Synergistes sp.]